MLFRFKAFFIFIAVILLSLLYFFYPATANHFYPGCALYRFTGFYCPACGGQRAFSELLHGHLLLAAQNNFLFVAAVFLLIFWSGKNANALLRGEITFNQTPSPLFWWTALFLILAFGLLRNIPFAPFTFLAPIAL